MKNLLVLNKQLSVYLIIIAVAFVLTCAISSIVTIPTLNQQLERAYERGYLQACQDIYQGIIKYDLVTHENGTRTWEKVDDRTTATIEPTTESR